MFLTRSKHQRAATTSKCGAALVALLGVTTTTFAQAPPPPQVPPDTGPPRTTTTSGMKQAPKGEGTGPSWTFGVKPYVWFAGLDGTVKAGQLPAGDVKADFNDLWDVLHVGGMLGLEARTPDGEFALLADLVYVRLEDDSSKVDGQISEGIGELALGYRPGPQKVFEILGGARFWSVSSEIDVSGVGERDRTDTWADPFLGGRAVMPLNDQLDLTVRADIGGFGWSSDLTWQAAAALDWHISELFGLGIGYRYLYVDHSQGDFDYEMTTAGPFLGASFTF